MNRSRHVARPVSGLRAVLWWSLPALVLAAAVLIYAGFAVVPTVAGCAGLFVLVLIVYVLDRSGLMRPPRAQRGLTAGQPPPTAQAPAAPAPPPQSAQPPPQAEPPRPQAPPPVAPQPGPPPAPPQQRATPPRPAPPPYATQQLPVQPPHGPPPPQHGPYDRPPEGGAR